MARIPASRLDHALDGHGLQVTWKGWFLTPASLPSMTTRPEGASPVPVTLYHCTLVRVPVALCRVCTSPASPRLSSSARSRMQASSGQGSRLSRAPALFLAAEDQI